MSNWDRFREQINLTEYAASMGYEVDRRASTRSSVKMRGGSDIVIISKKGGKWVYFSVVDDADNGSIINFVQNRSGKELKDIAIELLAWLGESAPHVKPKNYVQMLEDQFYDSERVQNIFKKCYPVSYHRYLQSRGITEDLLNSPRFKNRIFFDTYKNAVFPHYDKDGSVCGLELKNKEKGVVVRGSKKTFWRSNCQNGDTTLVIGEAVIDALSYALIYSNDKAIYAATGGGMSPEQGDLLKLAVKSLQTIIIITDNDKGGDKLADKLKVIILESGFSGEVIRHSPEVAGQDWNEVLQG